MVCQVSGKKLPASNNQTAIKVIGRFMITDAHAEDISDPCAGTKMQDAEPAHNTCSYVYPLVSVPSPSPPPPPPPLQCSPPRRSAPPFSTASHRVRGGAPGHTAPSVLPFLSTVAHGFCATPTSSLSSGRLWLRINYVLLPSGLTSADEMDVFVRQVRCLVGPYRTGRGKLSTSIFFSEATLPNVAGYQRYTPSDRQPVGDFTMGCVCRVRPVHAQILQSMQR